MGFLNLLEGPHSFAPELQRQRGGGGEEALFLPTSSPPKPAEPLALGGGGVNGGGLARVQAPGGGSKMLSLPLSPGL